MDQPVTSRLEADLFLLHAPSVYDFRERDDMLFAYLSDSDSVNVTSIYEMYPIGWFSIKQHLADHGFDTKIVNVASLMLMHPDLDVKRLLGRLGSADLRVRPALDDAVSGRHRARGRS